MVPPVGHPHVESGARLAQGHLGDDARLVPLRRIDAQDLGTPAGQQAGGHRSGQDPGEVEDPQSGRADARAGRRCGSARSAGPVRSQCRSGSAATARPWGWASHVVDGTQCRCRASGVDDRRPRGRRPATPPPRRPPPRARRDAEDTAAPRRGGGGRWCGGGSTRRGMRSRRPPRPTPGAAASPRAGSRARTRPRPGRGRRSPGACGPRPGRPRPGPARRRRRRSSLGQVADREGRRQAAPGRELDRGAGPGKVQRVRGSRSRTTVRSVAHDPIVGAPFRRRQSPAAEHEGSRNTHGPVDTVTHGFGPALRHRRPRVPAWVRDRHPVGAAQRRRCLPHGGQRVQRRDGPAGGEGLRLRLQRPGAGRRPDLHRADRVNSDS